MLQNGKGSFSIEPIIALNMQTNVIYIYYVLMNLIYWYRDIKSKHKFLLFIILLMTQRMFPYWQYHFKPCKRRQSDGGSIAILGDFAHPVHCNLTNFHLWRVTSHSSSHIVLLYYIYADWTTRSSLWGNIQIEIKNSALDMSFLSGFS